MTEGETALIVGAGPGLGAALGRAFAQDGMRVALAARSEDRIAALAREIDGARAYGCDAGDADSVAELFAAVESDLSAPRCVVFNAGSFAVESVLETTAQDLTAHWRTGCLGGFNVGQAAARRMKADGGGTILFTGATASLRGGARFHNLAIQKFGLRALAQSMARELQGDNIHVAHIVVDGVIDSERGRSMIPDAPEDGLLEPDAIAANYVVLHRQHRSAWTHELDLRPWSERF